MKRETLALVVCLVTWGCNGAIGDESDTSEESLQTAPQLLYPARNQPISETPNAAYKFSLASPVPYRPQLQSWTLYRIETTGRTILCHEVLAGTGWRVNVGAPCHDKIFTGTLWLEVQSLTLQGRPSSPVLRQAITVLPPMVRQQITFTAQDPGVPVCAIAVNVRYPSGYGRFHPLNNGQVDCRSDQGLLVAKDHYREDPAPVGMETLRWNGVALPAYQYPLNVVCEYEGRALHREALQISVLEADCEQELLQADLRFTMSILSHE